MNTLSCSYTLKIDETMFRICAHELYANVRTDFNSRGAVKEFPFDEGISDLNPYALLRGAGDNRIEHFADTRRQEQRCGGLPDLALDLYGVGALFRAMPR